MTRKRVIYETRTAFYVGNQLSNSAAQKAVIDQSESSFPKSLVN